MSGSRMHLIDGRRVRLSDLLEIGLLEPHTRLVFERPRLGKNFVATLTPLGKIELEDGAQFDSPSAAAAHASGISVDGWHAWRTSVASKLLDEYRQELLERIALESRSSGLAGQEAMDRHGFLKDARERAIAGEIVSLTVRDLIRYWGASSRGSKITRRIETDIDNHGLRTFPNFRQVRLDSVVRLELQAGTDAIGIVPAGEIADVSNEDAETAVMEIDSPTTVEVGLTLGNLESAAGGVMSVSPNDSIAQAITIMLLHDYSQLLVTSGTHTIKGAVTWESIARARHRNSDATLSDVIVGVAEERFDQELTEVLPVIADRSFVIVRGPQHEISGIVTAADVVHEYGELAGPFFLLGELDQLLRLLISSRFTEDEALDACNAGRDTPVSSLNDLSMGDYLAILRSEMLWKKLDWPLDRKIFCERIDALRELRNDVMHFNPDVDATNSVDQIRYAIRTIREYAGDL